MKILVIGAHADDPEVSMGGTIAKFVQNRNEVKIVVAIIPCEDIYGIPSEERKRQRWKACEDSAGILGAELEVLDLDPYQIWFKRDIVKLLDEKIREFSPNIIYTNWNHDSHQDHVTIANATFAATRKNNVSLLMYEQLTLGGLTPYAFHGQAFVDISDTMKIKMKSVRAYQSQIQQRGRWLEAIEGLATFRGQRIGVKYAEAFQAVRLLLDIKQDNCKINGFW